MDSTLALSSRRTIPYGNPLRTSPYVPGRREYPLTQYSLLNRGSLGPQHRFSPIEPYHGRFDDISRRRGYPPPEMLIARQDIYPSAQSLARRYSHTHSYPHFEDRYSRLCNCDIYGKSLNCHSDPCHHHNDSHCSCGSGICNNSRSSSSSSKDFSFKTKDITIRGKARAVRASYLTEAPKFETDLVKYLDKKKEDQVPDRVVGMLIDFINQENYVNTNPLDEVTLNILAHNVGAKSAVDFSSSRLKKFDGDMSHQELTNIIGTIVMSSKVDSGLKNWLKKYLQNEERFFRLYSSYSFRVLISSRPEVETETLRLLGRMQEAEDEGFRML